MTFTVADSTLTPAQVRNLCRTNTLPTSSTSGYAPRYVQANLLIMPSKYADDFRSFCHRNPVPCCLLGETKPGDPMVPSFLAEGCDIRTDIARYNVYRDGKLVANVDDITDEWKEDSVAFLIGCSFSFESALAANGLVPRNMEVGTTVPMYQTSVQLNQAGAFFGRMVVSMRPYPREKIPEVIAITRPYARTHGEPVAWGPEGAKRIGITDFQGLNPTWGDASEVKEGEIPVYWGCGVTPQQVVLDSGLPGTFISHQPGMMLVCDWTVEDCFKSS